MTDDAHCPHCRTLMRRAAPYPCPTSPTRCAACLLLVGPGRSCTGAGQRRALMASGTGPVALAAARPGPAAGSQPIDAVAAALREAHLTHTSVF